MTEHVQIQKREASAASPSTNASRRAPVVDNHHALHRTKFALSEPWDKCEIEADRLAPQISEEHNHSTRSVGADVTQASSIRVERESDSHLLSDLVERAVYSDSESLHHQTR